MSSDEMEKVVLEDLVVGSDEAGDVFDYTEAGEGDPAWEDDVDEHEDFGGGGVDEGVAFEVVGAFVGQFEGLVAEFEAVVVCEGHFR